MPQTLHSCYASIMLSSTSSARRCELLLVIPVFAAVTSIVWLFATTFLHTQEAPIRDSRNLRRYTYAMQDVKVFAIRFRAHAVRF
ncbi:hypothetical protein A0H81_13902 [Grifola frondosa]|uniref:Uncharacterized protein n=1 Tax=Grifola frondosa TaxID=5627 RepID=A0A1C7LN03_GRIFR|nr:hypothetical protein A0H81_13902 [Grifola frondosa]